MCDHEDKKGWKRRRSETEDGDTRAAKRPAGDECVAILDAGAQYGKVCVCVCEQAMECALTDHR